MRAGAVSRSSQYERGSRDNRLESQQTCPTGVLVSFSTLPRRSRPHRSLRGHTHTTQDHRSHKTSQEQMGGRRRGGILTRCKRAHHPDIHRSHHHRATGKSLRKKKRPNLHPRQSHHPRKRARSRPSSQKKKRPKQPAQPMTTSPTTKTPYSIRAKRRVATRSAKYLPISKTQPACLAQRAWEVRNRTRFARC